MAISMMQTDHLSGWLQGTAAFGRGMGLSDLYGDSLYRSNLNVISFYSAFMPKSQCSKPSALLAASFVEVGVERHCSHESLRPSR